MVNVNPEIVGIMKGITTTGWIAIAIAVTALVGFSNRIISKVFSLITLAVGVGLIFVSLSYTAGVPEVVSMVDNFSKLISSKAASIPIVYSFMKINFI